MKSLNSSHFHAGIIRIATRREDILKDLYSIATNNCEVKLSHNRHLWIKENPTQPFGLPNSPNDRIYLQTTSQGRLFKKVYRGCSFHLGKPAGYVFQCFIQYSNELNPSTE